MVALFLLLIIDKESLSMERFHALPSGFVAAESVGRSGKRLVAEQGVLAFAPTRAGRVLFTAEGAFFPAAVVGEEADGKQTAKRPWADSPDGSQALVVLGSGLAGLGKRAVEPRLHRPLPGKLNFLIGPAEDWQVGLSSFAELVYPGAWPGVDLIFEARAGGLGYRLELEAGAPAAAIELSTGAERLLLLEDGSLRAEREGAWLLIGRPRAFQRVDGRQMEVNVAFVPGLNGHYRFALGAYDPRLPLTIDPSLSWSTFLGGSGGDESYGIALDSAGSAYATGRTDSSNFPTVGAYNTSHNGNYDVFVSKLSADGSMLAYSTFLGGTSNDYGYGIALDSTGSAHVTGYTASTDFPTIGAYDSSHNGSTDVFVSKLSADGSMLAYSTLLGGTSNDYGYGIALDSTGSAHVTGYTESSDFPTFGAYDASFNGYHDAFVSKLSADGSTLAYSTYLGGIGDDRCFAIALGSAGSAHVAGYTDSGNFPTVGAYDTSHNGNYDVFVSKLSADGSALVYSTYLGGSSGDYGQDIALDSTGSAYVTGLTLSTDLPTILAYDSSHNDSYDAFVSKLSADGSSLVYSTFLGGSSDDLCMSIALDSAGAAHVTGYTYSIDFPSVGAYDSSHNGNYDVFVSKLSADGNSLVYSTFFGGSSDDHGRAIALDSTGSAYVTGYTESSDFPTFGAYDASRNGVMDVFASKLCAIAQPGSIAGLSSVCAGASAVGYSISAVPGAVDYTWSVPAGSSVTSGQGTTSITVDFGTTSGDVSVVANAPCPSDPQLLLIALLGAVTITGHPSPASACPGGSAAFSVSATGSGLSYQWRKGGFDLVGETGATLNLSSIGSGDAGSYSCVVSGSCGSATSSAAGLTVLDEVTITGHPSPASACPGGSAAFSVSATGSGVSYQWRKGGFDLVGETGATLNLSSISSGDAGSYDCVVSGSCGSETSSAASLEVWEVVTFSQQPGSVTRCIGDAATFSISASGTAPLSYQWYHDGSPLAGQTTASLTLDPIAALDAGDYHCEVSNLCGSADSDSALLNVDTNLMVTLNPPSAAQGVHFLVLNGGPLCGIPGYQVQWTNLTSGYVYGIDENPITVAPVLGETSIFEFRVTDGRSRATTTASLAVLVHHFDVFDWDNNGCSELADLWQAIQHWRSAYLGDPNDDGFMDIRDFLYINTDGCP